MTERQRLKLRWHKLASLNLRWQSLKVRCHRSAVLCHRTLTVFHRTLTDASLRHRSLSTAGHRLAVTDHGDGGRRLGLHQVGVLFVTAASKASSRATG
ncbi:hypothetical protein, partial [Streptomyces klenkii]